MGLTNAAAGGWSRGTEIGTWPPSDAIKRFKPFELAVWSGEDCHVLYGLCTFTNGAQHIIAIDGTEAADGQFYPTVVAQVADTQSGPWKTIGKSRKHGVAAKVRVKPMASSKSLNVDLGVFQTFIGKAKYGRLVLKRGDAAMFKLDTLTNPDRGNSQLQGPVQPFPQTTPTER